MGIKVKDLAHILNLSSSTVSLVLNNKPGISEETRTRVFQAIKDLGFEELYASEIADKKSYLFMIYQKSVIEPGGDSCLSSGFSEIMEGAQSQIKARGFNLMISYINEESIFTELNKVRKENLEGILILATDMSEKQITFLEEIKIPVVMIDNYMEHKKFSCITVNNEKGVYEAVKYLKDMGHKSIGYLHINNRTMNFSERYYGYLRAMELCGLYIDRENIFKVTAYGEEWAYQELKNMLKNRELPTAFFADNDILAVCAIRALRELGYKIPEDISIVGFENTALSELTDPPLTTIHIPQNLIGIIAANTVIDTGKELKGLLKIEVGTSLIIRNSVKQLN